MVASILEPNYVFFGLLSIFSIAHFVIPFFIGRYLEKDWLKGMWILIIFETLEISSGLSPEPIQNTLADLVIGFFGLYSGYKSLSSKFFKKLFNN